MEGALWAVLGLTGALVMRAGFAASSAGMVRSKNSAGMMMRHLADVCAAALAFWAVGMAITAGTHRFFGLEPRLLLGWSSSYPPIYWGVLGGALVATGIVPGVLAERARFWPAIAASAVLAGVVVPLAVCWAAPVTGWLGRMGFHDFGGAATVHWTGALCAAVGAAFVGPRTGKFNRDGSSTAIPGHSMPLAGLGVFLLVAGWIPFLGGRGAMNLLFGAAAGGMAAAVLAQVRYYKPDIVLTCAGVLGALVAVSAGGDAVRPFWAVVIGAGAGVIVPMAALLLDLRFRLDDPSGGVAIHGVGAAWGVLVTPLVMTGLSFGGRLKLFGVHLLGLVAIGALAVGLSAVVWAVMKRMTRIRAKEADEFDGLDLSEHDIGAYPDFQQNTIKSYHLREV